MAGCGRLRRSFTQALDHRERVLEKRKKELEKREREFERRKIEFAEEKKNVWKGNEAKNVHRWK